MKDGNEIGGSRVHFPSTPVKHLADLRNRAKSLWYSNIYEDRTPKIEDIERSDGETIKTVLLKRPELDRVTPINISSRPVSTEDYGDSTTESHWHSTIESHTIFPGSQNRSI